MKVYFLLLTTVNMVNAQNKYFVTWTQFHSSRGERKLTLELESRNEN